MKRTGFLFDRIWSDDNLRLAYTQARRGKAMSADATEFGRALDRSLSDMRTAFMDGGYRFGPYRQFEITDPKKRTISAAPFRDRVAHHAIMNVLEPLFERRQLNDSYACRKGKGTHAAVLRVFNAARARPYFVKLDVRKYFDSIDHGILFERLCGFIKDTRLLELLGRLIASYETTTGKGVPIGNLTSQYFANEYLCALDHFMKERVSVPVWVRYMDDMIALGRTRAEMAPVVPAVEEFCRVRLGLSLKTPVSGSVNQGLPFLGFLLCDTGIFLTRRTKVRYKEKSKALEYRLKRGLADEVVCAETFMAMIAHTELARSRRFRYSVNHGARSRATTA